MKFPIRILAASLLVAVGGTSLASERMPGGFFPIDETAFLAGGSNAAKRIAPGVYEVVDKGQRVTVAYGVDGLRYRVAQLESMVSHEKKRASRPGAEALLETFRAGLAAAEGSLAKDYSDISEACAGTHDGYVYAEGAAEPGFNWATAEASASYDGFGPHPEGTFFVETIVEQQGYWYGPSCEWMATAGSLEPVTAVFGASTGQFTTVSNDGYSSGGRCAGVRAYALFKHEGVICASAFSGL